MKKKKRFACRAFAEQQALMQREHPSRVRRTPPDRDYNNLTTKRARLEPQDGTSNSEQLTEIERHLPTQMQKRTSISASVSKPTFAPRKKHSPPINARSKKPSMSADSAHPKTMEKMSTEARETEAKDILTDVADESVPEGETDVGETEVLEEETAEKEIG